MGMRVQLTTGSASHGRPGRSDGRRHVAPAVGMRVQLAPGAPLDMRVDSGTQQRANAHFFQRFQAGQTGRFRQVRGRSSASGLTVYFCDVLYIGPNGDTCDACTPLAAGGTSALTGCLCDLGYKEPKGANFDGCTWLVSARSAAPDGATALHLHLCIFPGHLAWFLSPIRGSLRSDLGKTNESCEKLVRQNGPHFHPLALQLMCIPSRS